MAQDIRELFKNDEKAAKVRMPEGHQNRFLEKLDQELPQNEDRVSSWSWMQIAATLVVLLGLSFGALKYFQTPETSINTAQKVATTKTLGDVSPDLKKVEDYYMANINLELSKVKLTPENKELFDGYLQRLEELNSEYNKLSLELTDKGPDELTINALINNLVPCNSSSPIGSNGVNN